MTLFVCRGYVVVCAFTTRVGVVDDGNGDDGQSETETRHASTRIIGASMRLVLSNLEQEPAIEQMPPQHIILMILWLYTTTRSPLTSGPYAPCLRESLVGVALVAQRWLQVPLPKSDVVFHS
jgi:hypothetical protein